MNHNQRLWGILLGLSLASLFLVGRTLPTQARPVGTPPPPKVSAHVWETAAESDESSFLILLVEQADLSAAPDQPSREARLRYVYDTLRDVALRTQPPLHAELDRAGAVYRPFYVVNMIAAKGDRALIANLAQRSEVARIAANPWVRQTLPDPAPNNTPPDQARSLAPQAIEWGVRQVNADDVWALGFTGQGVVVAGQDTGYDWTHPALQRQYRGFDGITVTHDYNWHDAIHSGGGVCGADSPAPCDDHGHGTHTMGTIVGHDGGSNQIGVAPGARWIGCRNMDRGVGSPATYAECFQFFLAPYPLDGDPFIDGDPARAPHVINNSWTCPVSEGCTDPDVLLDVVENVRAAGILVVASAGNSGSSCSSVREPPAIYDAAFSVGATNSSDGIASFSSRGPVTVDGSGRMKPQIAAPGVSVRSSYPGGRYGTLSGTSMAGPHVAGTAALLWSAAPVLIGDVATTEHVITRTARPRTTSQTCGDDVAGDVPNNVYGWGIVDALAAVQEDIPGLAMTKRVATDTVAPGALLTYTLQITNTGTVTLSAIVTDYLPLHIEPSQTSGGTVLTPGGVLTWTPTITAPGGVWRETLALTAANDYSGPLTNVVHVNTVEGAHGAATVSVTIPPVLDVDKQASSAVVFAGAPLTYTLLVTNISGIARAVIVTDHLPLHIEPGQTGEGTALTPGGALTWTPTITGPGGVWRETLALTVTNDYSGPLTNVLRAASLEGWGDVSVATVEALVRPLLDIHKGASPTIVSSGAPLTYTIGVTNAGRITRTVVVTDRLPLHIEPGQTSEGTALTPGGALTWTPTITAPGGVWRETVVVTIAPDYTGPLTNVVYVATAEGLIDSHAVSVIVVRPWLFLPVFLRQYRHPNCPTYTTPYRRHGPSGQE